MVPYSCTFLHHSGVLVETEQHQIFIDVHFDSVMTKAALVALINADKQTFFFVTHGHRDHFEPEIFENLNDQGVQKPTYVISEDVKDRLSETEQSVLWVEPNQTYTLASEQNDEITIKTFKSTDLGVAFLINVDGVSVFHSGDLNWWHWKNATLEMQEQEEKDYKSIMDLVIKESIDLAFVPIDVRLENSACLAMTYFAKRSNAKVIVPIHFGQEFDALHASIQASYLKDEIRLLTPSHKIERLL